MFFYISKILDFIISPVNMIWIILGLSFIKKKFFIKHAIKLRLFAVVLFFVFTNPYIINQLLYKWEMKGIKVKSIIKPYDVAIVLGGYMKYYNSELETISFSDAFDRLGEASMLYHKGKIKNILLSGGNASLNYQPAEALIAKQYLTKYMCIPDSCIFIDTLSKNTYQNIIESKMICNSNNFKSRILITSAFHLRRSLAICKKQNFLVAPYATDQYAGKIVLTPTTTIIPKSENFVKWELYFHELIGYVVYKVKRFL